MLGAQRLRVDEERCPRAPDATGQRIHHPHRRPDEFDFSALGEACQGQVVERPAEELAEPAQEGNGQCRAGSEPCPERNSGIDSGVEAVERERASPRGESLNVVEPVPPPPLLTQPVLTPRPELDGVDADPAVVAPPQLYPRALGNSYREDKTARVIGVLANEVGPSGSGGSHLGFGAEELSELTQGEIGSAATMAQHLTRDQLKRFEERLQRERERLLGLTRAPATPAEMPGLADPSDAADIAEEQVARSTRNTLSETERAQLAQVDRALSKLRAGTYGLSDVTGEPIPVPRLEALPWATTNVEDASGQR